MSDRASRMPSEVPTDAAGWDARLRASDCTEAERAAFKRWCAAEPGNQQAFDDLQRILEGLRAGRDRPEIRSLREAALDAANPKPKVRRWLASSAVLVVAAAVLIGILQSLYLDDAPPVSTAPSYATAVGERSTTTLTDGTVAVLNTNTRLVVAFSEHERVVRLLRGQALFEVAKDPARQFTVIAGEQRITAVGTVFDVRFEGNTVAVTLVEGVVDVVPVEPIGMNLGGPVPEVQPVRLSAGQRLVTRAPAGRQAPVVETADLETATMWRQGRVFFEDVPLSAAVAEMNRYSTTPIVLADATLDRFRVNGMFRTGQQANFVHALAAYFPIRLERDANGRFVLSEPSGNQAPQESIHPIGG